MGNEDLRRRSVATIDGPEFINVEPANPNISKCEIKVCYVGKNRNGSFITKEVLSETASTLPGCPIVGAYREDRSDFGDHGEKIVIEDGEIKFSCKTVPYGFVPPDAKVWFQKFIDTDEFGNDVEREYLMTTGYLWTGQYEEVRVVLEEGRSQSMEFDPEKLDGHWAKDAQSGMEFFIINDAIFTKLCILGENVEPCFEGASVTSPEVSRAFSKDESFAKTLFSMMNELKDALSDKGGLDMLETEYDDNTAAEEGAPEASLEDIETEVDEEIQDSEPDNEPAAAPDVEEEGTEELPLDGSSDGPEPEFTAEQFEALAAQNRELADENRSLRAEVEELRAFRLSVEDREKDQLIDKYFMLSDEDKADIVAHKSEFTLDEIEAKLAVLYVNKNVQFSEVDDSEAEEEAASVTFNLDNEVEGVNVSNIARALRATSKKLY